MSKTNRKQHLVKEVKRFFVYSLFLTLFFSAFTLYRRLVLSAHDIDYLHYEYGVIESMVLAKIILLGQMLHLGERFEDRPLIVPTLYKTLIFSFFVFLFSIGEHFVVGLLRGSDFATVNQDFVDNVFDEILAKIVVMFFFFVFFFAFLEISRVMGEGKLFELFFKKRDSRNR